MPASGPRSRGARVHPRSCQGCQPWPRATAASGLVLATQKLDGITGRGASLARMGRAVVLSGVRTPVGRYGGVLAEERPDNLAALVIREAVERAGVDPGEIEDVYFGAANQAGEDNRNVARMASLLAGLPDSVPGVTV